MWNILGSKGETPIISQRYLNYMDNARVGGGRFDIDSVTHVITGRRFKERILPAKCDVRSIASPDAKSEVPSGKNLIVIGKIGQVLHFRMYDAAGKLVVDTDETRYRDRARQIEDLRNQVAGLWPPHQLSGSEKALLSAAVSAIIRQTIPVPAVRVGSAYIHKNTRALPRVRLAGRPIYARDQAEAIALIDRLTMTDQLRDHVVVEDPTHPLASDALVNGSARIAHEIPERLEVETASTAPAFLVVSDSFDPGWSATVDGQPVNIYPAYCAFRAVFLPPGNHSIIFRYSPAGFTLGLSLTLCGMLAALLLWFLQPRSTPLTGEHAIFDGPPHFRVWYLAALLAIVLASIPALDPHGRPTTQDRWTKSLHRFTWASGIEAIKQRPVPAPESQPPESPPLDAVDQ